MHYPNDLHYTNSHEWFRETENGFEVGLTSYAQESLGDLVFVNLPQPGDIVTVGSRFCDVESVKAVSDVYSPVTGVISEVNQLLLDTPELINQSPYDAWFIRVNNVTEKTQWLDAAAYEAFVKED